MSLQTLAEIIDNLHELGEGELTLTSGASTWQLHLAGGQLIYPVNAFHRVRRWERAIREQQLNWHWRNPEKPLTLPSFWELRLFEQGFAQQQLSPKQAKLIVRSVVQECFFELGQGDQLQSDWQPVPKPLSSSSKAALLSARELQRLYHKAVTMRQAWQSANFGDLSPSLAPVLTQAPDPECLPVHPKYLTGQFSLWDISLWVGQPLTSLTRSFSNLAAGSYLRFEPLSDLSALSARTAANASLGSPRPLVSESVPVKPAQTRIACVDDSPVLAHSLSRRLKSAGYGMIRVEEPIQNCARLIEYNPDLILLALNSPNDGGYGICKFLRKTPMFEKTPIIILTGRDTCIDRLKAKMAGATAFLAKPPQSQELLGAIQQLSATKIPLLLSAA
ncbi:MAG: response regulator [Cyanobacteria bacterium P01_A01_bin.114]